MNALLMALAAGDHMTWPDVLGVLIIAVLTAFILWVAMK